MSNIRDVKRRPFRIQGTAAYSHGTEFHNANKAYETFDEAQHAAAVQSCNAGNINKGNKFIIYKAVAIVGPTRPPIETIYLDESCRGQE